MATPLTSYINIFVGRTSVSTHENNTLKLLENTHKKQNKKGSITIEAALAVPIFFFAVISLLYLMEIMSIQTAVRSGLQYAGKQAAAETYALTVLVPSKVESDVVHSIGAERLERSIVVGGSSGIHCERSYMSPNTGIGELTAEYDVKLPIPMFRVPAITYRESMRIKAWTGYEKSGLGNENDDIVYVTETGIVYHRDYHCTHLDLSIHMAQASELDTLRNESGGKYYPCEKCAHGVCDAVYITNTGDRYHSSLSCSGLKRTVYAVKISEVVGKGACSKCGK